MNKKKIALISDIHGNSIALQEVIEDIKNQGIKTIINLGDSLYGPLDPIGTFDILVANNVISISGNQDRFIIENLNSKSTSTTLEYVKSCLNDNVIDWLLSLPYDLILKEGVYCCHASPESDSTCLLENLQKDKVTIKTTNELDNILSGIQHRIIVCGHSHIPRIVETKDRKIINPGSVGLPAYDDELPVYHKMENFSPRANYSILDFSSRKLRIEQVSLTYDFEKVAKIAETNGRNDWAHWIRTGIV